VNSSHPYWNLKILAPLYCEPGCKQNLRMDPNCDTQTNLLDCPHCTRKNLNGRRGIAIHIGSQHANQTTPSDQSDCTFKDHLFRLKSNIAVLRRIPQAAKHVVAENLSTSINTCVNENSSKAWQELLTLTLTHMTLTLCG